MVSGAWSGTMNLTEPHCGTDLGLIRTKAEPQADGSYSISGQKIWISGGENDLAENIVHLVLAKTPEELQRTDIADHALEALSRSRIREITVIGRRGPVQAAFTPRELKEIGSLGHVSVETGPGELELDEISRAALEAAPVVQLSLEVAE